MLKGCQALVQPIELTYYNLFGEVNEVTAKASYLNP